MIFALNFLFLLRFISRSWDRHYILSYFLELTLHRPQLICSNQWFLPEIPLSYERCWRSDPRMRFILQHFFSLTQRLPHLSCLLRHIRSNVVFVLFMHIDHLADIIRLEEINTIHCLERLCDCRQLQETCFSSDTVELDSKVQSFYVSLLI